MIIFKKLRLKNFMSYGNSWTEIDLNTNKNTLIIGKNGEGKSTPFLDCLSFVLYNKAYRNINKNQMINSINKKDCLTEIEFTINNISYRIIRGMKPNVFEIYKNGVLLNPTADNRDYQTILEKNILKMSYKTFRQVVVLGTSTYTPFMQLPAQQRREVIEDLLDLEVFSTMNVLLKEKVNQNQTDIQNVETSIKILEEKINISREYEKRRVDNIKSLEKGYLESISNIKKDIEDKTIQRDIALASLENLNNEANILEKEIAEKGKVISIKTKLEHRLSESLDKTRFFHDNDVCPTCKQAIDNSFKCDMIKEEEDIQKKINETIIKANDKIKQLSLLNDKLSIVNTSRNRLNNNISILNNTISMFNDNINKIKKQILELRDNSEDTIDNNIDVIKEELSSVLERKAALLDKKMLLSHAAVILKDSGIKAKLVKQYISIINKTVNKYLGVLNFHCQFEMDENFNEVIKSRYRDEFTYASFSEGEKARINLAILFAWRAISKMRNASSTNLLILDEVLDNALDAAGAEDFIRILNSVEDDKFNAFVISHKTDQVIDNFDNVIKIQKVKNFSTIVKQ